MENIRIDREYLQRVKNKHFSTLYLLSQEDFELGVERLETFIKKGSKPEYGEWRGTVICGRKA